MEQTILIIAEHIEGRISPATFELVACARVLQGASNLSIKIIISGYEIQTIATLLAIETGLDVIVIPSHQSSTTQTEIFKAVPAVFFTELNPVYICIHNNSFGQEMASGLAIKLNANCITGVEKIIYQKDRFCFSRKIFNDMITMSIVSNSGITVLSIQSGVFKPVRQNNIKKGIVKTVQPVFLQNLTHHLGYTSNKLDTSNLADAEVIISAGNGIGKSENLDLIYRLASLFPKSCVAGSRPVCDRKWLAYNQQVGATGATVRPKLYIACGISGASQHIAGMRDSKMIVAINTDLRAAICQFADICIIEDLSLFIPVFADVYQKETNTAQNEKDQIKNK